MEDIYQDIIIEEAKNPSHFGKMDYPDKTHQQFNASCGDIIEVFIKFDKTGKKIKKISWTGDGCTISKATMSLLTQEVEDKNISEITSLGQEDLLSLLGIEEISPGRVKCLHIGLNAVKKALE